MSMSGVLIVSGFSNVSAESLDIKGLVKAAYFEQCETVLSSERAEIVIVLSKLIHDKEIYLALSHEEKQENAEIMADTCLVFPEMTFSEIAKRH